MSMEQILTYEDSKTQNVMRFICKKRNVDSFELDCCFAPIYRMKLNSSEVNSEVLTDGNNTASLIHELRSIYNNTDNIPVIDFSKVLEMFNNSECSEAIIKESVERLLSMYDIEKDSEMTKEEWTDTVKKASESKASDFYSFSDKRKEAKSLISNTEALKYINLRNYQKRK